MAPVVISVLAPTLDKSLTEDGSPCPVRALCYYLDRTKDLRDNKQLVFVFFKKNFDRDISPATISSWIKQSILLCYKLSDQEALQMHQVKPTMFGPMLLPKLSRISLPRADPLGLLLEVPQYVHTVLLEGCCLG